MELDVLNYKEGEDWRAKYLKKNYLINVRYNGQYLITDVYPGLDG